LVGLVSSGKFLQHVGSALRGELIVSEADTDGSARKIEAIHLLQSLPSLASIAVPEDYMLVGTSSSSDRGFILDKAVASAAAVLLLLELDELELAERLEDSLQILLSDVVVNVSDVEAVEGDRVGVRASSAFLSADLAILFGLGDLDDDRNT
jgi:hypothetical protein